MSTLSLRLPDSLHRKLKELAAREGYPSTSSWPQRRRKRWLRLRQKNTCELELSVVERASFGEFLRRYRLAHPLQATSNVIRSQAYMDSMAASGCQTPARVIFALKAIEIRTPHRGRD